MRFDLINIAISVKSALVLRFMMTKGLAPLAVVRMRMVSCSMTSMSAFMSDAKSLLVVPGPPIRGICASIREKARRSSFGKLITLCATASMCWLNRASMRSTCARSSLVSRICSNPSFGILFAIFSGAVSPIEILDSSPSEYKNLSTGKAGEAGQINGSKLAGDSAGITCTDSVG